MTIARIENGQIAEISPKSLSDIPPAKQSHWRTVVGDPPTLGPCQIATPTYTLTEPTVTATWAVSTVVPLQVTPYQARAALLAAGLLDTVDAAVKASSDKNLQTVYEYAQYWERNSSFITTMAQSLSLTSAELDALFVNASTY